MDEKLAADLAREQREAIQRGEISTVPPTCSYSGKWEELEPQEPPEAAECNQMATQWVTLEHSERGDRYEIPRCEEHAYAETCPHPVVKREEL